MPHDLCTKGTFTEANELESQLQARQIDWAQSPAPFDSEQAWDCTAQEGVYCRSQCSNDTVTTQHTIQLIHSYDPAISRECAGRRRFFAANIGLFAQPEGGQIERVAWAAQTQQLTMGAIPDISDIKRHSVQVLGNGKRIELATGDWRSGVVAF
ncbi:uncharacterized protein BO80DRAFT_443044 [Aspergillus ibericus CBS 121593]|uniref:Uncharacterized protein n=1 Tax=Aspergillus ibericus CBS 121593 TaxID=1448316 RepID=A0A395H793_9EURO|nr:hypothetical protein BO80DRAFT_443044 [Aspergillus ibericus CBS 121593]RAL03373.1 hypothetical protein BO80DRAFT_443044 [Aspergillus ibericus CBS 121593]